MKAEYLLLSKEDVPICESQLSVAYCTKNKMWKILLLHKSFSLNSSLRKAVLKSIGGYNSPLMSHGFPLHDAVPFAGLRKVCSGLVFSLSVIHRGVHGYVSTNLSCCVLPFLSLVLLLDKQQMISRFAYKATFLSVTQSLCVFPSRPEHVNILWFPFFELFYMKI